ncbi:hypothetical protein IL306_012877 [Fusarium sp. DS 682]|nr:hypothetical protein IL306_012877 [Fusarium sp. DS 682]
MKCLWSYLGPDAKALYLESKHAPDGLLVDATMIDAGDATDEGDDSDEDSYRVSNENPEIWQGNPEEGEYSDDLVEKPYHELYPEIEEKGFYFGCRQTVTTDNNSETDESEIKLPEPEFRDLMDDWYSGNAVDKYEDDDSEAEEEATRVDPGGGEPCQKFNLQKVLGRVATMDLDDSHIDAAINDALRANEIENLRITLQHKESIFSGLPNNQASIDIMEANPNIRAAVETFRLRLKQLINNLATFALAYLLKQQDWTVDTFDKLEPKLNCDKSNQDDIEGMPLQSTVRSNTGQSASDRNEINENLAKLMECHEVPKTVPLSPTACISRDGDVTVESSTAADHEDKAFELVGVDALSTRGQLFSIRSKHIGIRNAKAPSGTTRKWIGNVCPWCGVMMPAGPPRTKHQKRCWGKCYRCDKLKQPCHSDGNGTCEGCKAENLQCERPDPSTLGLYLSGVCDHCGLWKRAVKEQAKKCRGRCQFRSKDQACEKKEDKCKRCIHLDLPCGGFERSDGSDALEQTCGKCGTTIRGGGMSQHRAKCRERCTKCDLKQVACFRHNSTTKGPCTECRTSDDPDSCDGSWRTR